jgi:hypothetical protein
MPDDCWVEGEVVTEEKERKVETVLICCRSKVSEARAARAKSRGFLISLAVTLNGINGWQKELGQSCARAFRGGGEMVQEVPRLLTQP